MRVIRIDLVERVLFAALKQAWISRYWIRIIFVGSTTSTGSGTWFTTGSGVASNFKTYDEGWLAIPAPSSASKLISPSDRVDPRTDGISLLSYRQYGGAGYPSSSATTCGATTRCSLGSLGSRFEGPR